MPSSRPEPRSTEEYLRSRRLQLKRHIDASNRLAGLYYNAYHNRWEPDWGVPFEGKCDEPETGENGDGINGEGES